MSYEEVMAAKQAAADMKTDAIKLIAAGQSPFDPRTEASKLIATGLRIKLAIHGAGY